jgi:hypothetical protein
MQEVIHLSTVFTKKEKKKQKKKERTTTTNLNSRNWCVDKREHLTTGSGSSVMGPALLGQGKDSAAVYPYRQ